MDTAFKLFVGLYTTTDKKINKIIKQGKTLQAEAKQVFDIIAISAYAINNIRLCLETNKKIKIKKPYGVRYEKER
jgi:hypothetical protein